MRVRLRLSNQELADDLLDFLRRREEKQAEMELDLLLRVWQVMHPGIRIEVIR